MELDHLILRVNDADESCRFYTEILRWTHEGKREPFTIVRVTSHLTIQLAPWGTKGGEHLAFAMTRAEFDEIFRRIWEGDIEYGDSFHSVGNMQGPDEEDGARGPGASLYFIRPEQILDQDQAL
jgi:catechol 2,3-dioxygenase-like lactoylglutathione lyase family enzyme